MNVVTSMEAGLGLPWHVVVSSALLPLAFLAVSTALQQYGGNGLPVLLVLNCLSGFQHSAATLFFYSLDQRGELSVSVGMGAWCTGYRIIEVRNLQGMGMGIGSCRRGLESFLKLSGFFCV